MFIPNSPRPPRGIAARDCEVVLVLLKEKSAPDVPNESYHSGMRSVAGAGVESRDAEREVLKEAALGPRTVVLLAIVGDLQRHRVHSGFAVAAQREWP